MRVRTRGTIAITTVAVFALAGTAYALSVDPPGGPPGSTYQVSVDCNVEPSVRVFPLQAIPQATVPTQDGTETSPGTWIYDVQARNVDELVTSDCDGTQEQFRYDVDAPALFPGPTVAVFGDFDLDVSGTTMIGTDCPAGTTASVTITGPDGYTNSQTAPIDRYGNWEVPVPDAAPEGRLQAEASCGALTFEPLTFRHPGSTVPGDGATTGGSPGIPAASAVQGTPAYTG